MKLKNREDLAAEWLPQIERWLKGYIRQRPEFSHHYDDFLSDCTIKMIERIDRFLSEKREFDDHFSHGLRITIMNEINSFLRYEYVRAWKRRVDYDRLPQESFLANWIWFNEDEGFLSYLKHKQHPPNANINLTPYYDPPHEEQSPESILFEACEDSVDVSIIQGRLNGLTENGVAKQIGISRSTVYRRLKKLRMRYERAKK